MKSLKIPVLMPFLVMEMVLSNCIVGHRLRGGAFLLLPQIVMLYLSTLLKLKAKGNQVQEVGPSDSPTLSQWYFDPKVLKEIDEMVGRIRVVRKRTADIDRPNFDLGISDLDTTSSPPSPPKNI
ncbi:unnamed protein product [Amaranthus hypochondriacus]